MAFGITAPSPRKEKMTAKKTVKLDYMPPPVIPVSHSDSNSSSSSASSSSNDVVVNSIVMKKQTAIDSSNLALESRTSSLTSVLSVDTLSSTPSVSLSSSSSVDADAYAHLVESSSSSEENIQEEAVSVLELNHNEDSNHTPGRKKLLSKIFKGRGSNIKKKKMTMMTRNKMMTGEDMQKKILNIDDVEANVHDGHETKRNFRFHFRDKRKRLFSIFKKKKEAKTESIQGLDETHHTATVHLDDVQIVDSDDNDDSDESSNYLVVFTLGLTLVSLFMFIIVLIPELPSALGLTLAGVLGLTVVGLGVLRLER